MQQLSVRQKLVIILEDNFKNKNDPKTEEEQKKKTYNEVKTTSKKKMTP